MPLEGVYPSQRWDGNGVYRNVHGLVWTCLIKTETHLNQQTLEVSTVLLSMQAKTLDSRGCMLGCCASDARDMFIDDADWDLVACTCTLLPLKPGWSSLDITWSGSKVVAGNKATMDDLQASCQSYIPVRTDSTDFRHCTTFTNETNTKIRNNN